MEWGLKNKDKLFLEIQPHIYNNYYQLYRTIKEPKTLPSEMVNELKDLWLCTHTFRKDGMLYFCREVQTIEYELIN